MNASLDCDGNDVLRCTPEQFGSETPEAEAQPRQGHTGQENSPRDKLWRHIMDEKTLKVITKLSLIMCNNKCTKS